MSEKMKKMVDEQSLLIGIFWSYVVTQLLLLFLVYKNGERQYLYQVLWMGIPTLFMIRCWLNFVTMKEEHKKSTEARIFLEQGLTKCPDCKGEVFNVHHIQTEKDSDKCYIMECKCCDATGVLALTFRDKDFIREQREQKKEKKNEG